MMSTRQAGAGARDRAARGILATILTLVLCLVFCAPAALAQDDVRFTAGVDRNQLTTDDVLTLQLTLAGAFRSAGQPQMPALEDFEALGSRQSSQFSMVNGKTSSQVVYIYQLRPTKAGELTIPAIPITLKDKTYTTQPITVTVSQGAAPSTPSLSVEPSAPAAGEIENEDVYVEALVDVPEAVVGQQVTYSFRLFQAVQLFNQPQLDWPEFNGFLQYDLTPNLQYYQEVSGRQYLVTEVRKALFATGAGQKDIPPAVLTIPGDWYNRGISLQTEPVSIHVAPFPDDAPADFEGAVGQFGIEAWVEPAETRANEPVMLYVRLAGAGNASVLHDPTVAWREGQVAWRVYEPEASTSIQQDGEVMKGEKLLKVLLVPRSAGELEIPAFGLTYYDPAAMEYRRAESEPITVNVTPAASEAPTGSAGSTTAKQDVALLATDIRHIKAAPPALLAGRVSVLRRPLYWAGWLLPALAVIAAWVMERRRRHLAGNVALARAQGARRLARKRLSVARRLSEEDEDAAYQAVAQVLAEYLGDKCNLPAAGLTRDAIELALTERAVNEEWIERLLTCLDWADAGRFAPVAAGRDARQLVDEAEEIIAELEAQIVA